MKLSFPAFLVATGLLAESTNAQQRLRFLQPTREESSMSSNDDRLKELEAAFPCLGSLASQTVVGLYTEQDNTTISTQGLVSDATGPPCSLPVRNTKLETEFGQSFSKSEMKQICVTKCEDVLEGCSIFEVAEITNSQGEIRYACYFFTDASIGAQHSVENPMIYTDIDQLTTGFTYASSVFYKGQDLLLVPKFQGCDVPVGDDVKPVIECRLGQYLSVKYLDEAWPPSAFGFPSRADCAPVLANLTTDFENYIFPSVECTFEDFFQKASALTGLFEKLGAAGSGLNGCLDCLSKAEIPCDSRPICDEENFITKKCPGDLDKCTSSGKDNKCGTCGDFCPQEETCVVKLQTALLCSTGATPVFNSVQQDGGCLNADIDGLGYDALVNGDYQCLPEL